jgi:hypothetical protein
MELTRRTDRGVLEHRPAGAAHRVCAATPCFSTPVPASADAAEVARAFAAAHLCEEHGQEAAGAVLLLVSELVTHALFYGAPPIVVTLECEVSQVRVTVTDGSPLVGTPDSVHRELSLLLIGNVAGDWALEPGEYGETFWCTIPTRQV